MSVKQLQETLILINSLQRLIVNLIEESFDHLPHFGLKESSISELFLMFPYNAASSNQSGMLKMKKYVWSTAV